MDKFESLALWMALEISKNSDGDYAKLETRIAWSVWQSRQSEFDAMTEALLNQTQLLAKQKVELEEKDKRINQALNFINNWWHPDLDQKLFVEALGRALRGEHE